MAASDGCCSNLRLLVNLIYPMVWLHETDFQFVGDVVPFVPVALVSLVYG